MGMTLKERIGFNVRWYWNSALYMLGLSSVSPALKEMIRFFNKQGFK